MKNTDEAAAEIYKYAATNGLMIESFAIQENDRIYRIYRDDDHLFIGTLDRVRGWIDSHSANL